MSILDVELETLVSETDALTTRPSPCAENAFACFINRSDFIWL